MTPHLHTLTRPLAGLVLAGAMLLPTAATAQDTEPAVPAGRVVDLEAARDRCSTGIDKRMDALDEASGRIAEAAHLTDEHEETLVALVSDTVTGLTELDAAITAATDAGALRSACQAVVYEHRVFVLRLPQIHATIGGDTGSHVVATFAEIAPELGDAIAEAQAAGLDVRNSPELLAEAETAAQAAAEHLAGTTEALLALTPDDVNSGAAEPIAEGVRDDLKSARAQLELARDNGRAVVEILRALHTP